MEILIIRHAIAAERNATRWPDDRDRPLTPEGEARFRTAARGLARIVGEVDVVLSSPLARAWRTAELLTEEAGWPEPISFEALEPDRSATEVVEALRSHRSQDVVALVGHEPLLGELIALLLTGSDEGEAFSLKKGGAASVTMDGESAGATQLRWLLTPKVERALGK